MLVYKDFLKKPSTVILHVFFTTGSTRHFTFHMYVHIFLVFRLTWHEDWRVYAGGVIYFGLNCALASISAFLPTIITTFGYSGSFSLYCITGTDID